MNIRLTWNFDLESYKTLFPEIELFTEKDYGTTIDLLVFPGGEDVSLDYYLGTEDVRAFSNLCHTNRDRDSYEMDILDSCYDSRKLNIKKILGICRGMQFLNVAFYGSLFPDLKSFGYETRNVHSLKTVVPNNLEFLSVVNSMHHQAIRKVGTFNRRGNRNGGTIVSTDADFPTTEIIQWENGRILGVQFHPEYFDDGFEGKELFKEFCYKWIEGKATILK